MKDLDFIIELEKMKKIERRTKVIGEDRRENDAEHSWHIAVMAMLLKDYADEEIRKNLNVDKVVKMLLVHDIVEIYAGDTFAYDIVQNEDKKERELLAMKKIRERLSDENAVLVDELWTEFEKMETTDSMFANAMDRLQPMMSNLCAEDGGSWREFHVTRSQIMKRMAPISAVSERLSAYVLSNLEEHIRKGNVMDR